MVHEFDGVGLGAAWLENRSQPDCGVLAETLEVLAAQASATWRSQ